MSTPPPSIRETRILSGFAGLDAVTRGLPGLRHEWIGCRQGVWGLVSWVLRAPRALCTVDYLVFNNDQRRLLVACAARAVLRRFLPLRGRIVSIDLLLPPGADEDRGLATAIKVRLLGEVEAFGLYFRRVDGYVRFGIPPERISYLPFKVNSWDRLRARRAPSDGAYVLLAGATHRDHATFVAAVRRAGVPGVLLVPGQQRAEVERSEWFRAGLPLNLRLVYHTDGREETYTDHLAGAAAVCIPRFRRDIGCTGISAYLCAMALGKCVLISRGPGADDVLSEHGAALFFEPEDVEDLSALLRRVWEDRELRHATGARGARYADVLGGEERLLRDVLDLAMGPALRAGGNRALPERADRRVRETAWRRRGEREARG